MSTASESLTVANAEINLLVCDLPGLMGYPHAYLDVVADALGDISGQLLIAARNAQSGRPAGATSEARRQSAAIGGLRALLRELTAAPARPALLDERLELVEGLCSMVGGEVPDDLSELT